MTDFSKRRRSTLRCAVLAAAAISLFSFPALAGEKWDMPAAYSSKNHVSAAYAHFADLVGEKTGGELEIVVHPAGSLYKGSEIMRAVRSGQVPIGGRYLGAHASDDPVFGLDTVPFLATDFDEARLLYDASKDAIAAALEERDMKLIFAAPWPPQGLFAKKEIASAADMEGVRFRAYDANTSRLAQLMGAIPTKTEATEISQAFSTGVAESMIGSGAIGVFQKLWDYVDYFYLVNAWIPKSVVIVNMDAWDELSPETQAAVLEAGAEAEAAVWTRVTEVTDGYNATLAENGIDVVEPSEQLKEDLRKIGETMAAEWAEEADDNGKAAIEAYLSSK